MDLAPIYANASAGGGKPDQYWPERPSNLTAISLKVNEFVNLVNENYRTRTPFDTMISKRWPGANVVNFDVHSLVCVQLCDLTILLLTLATGSGYLQPPKAIP